MKIFLLILAMIMNLNQHLNPKHTELFQSTDFELAVRGGANAEKTYSIADKMLLQPVWQPDKKLKALILRKTLPALKNSVLDIMERRAEIFKLPFQVNRNENTGQCLNMKYVFLSLNNKEDYYKIKSITDVDFIWINEINEIRETDYELLKTRIRGGQSSFKQLVIDFNPIGKTSWVFTRFYQKNIGNVRKLRYTIFDNPWASQDEIKTLKATKEHNPNFYTVYFRGEWGDLKGLIFPNWDIVPEPPKNPDEIFYGGDFQKGDHCHRSEPPQDMRS
jgi:PBSX family phage terminase large subunit